MARKHNTRSIKALQDREADRIDRNRRLKQKLGQVNQNTPTQGQGWNFIPAPR
jgi:hypothetical protein